MKTKQMMSRFALTATLLTSGSVVAACLAPSLLGSDDTLGAPRVITWPAITLSLLLGSNLVLHLYRCVRDPAPRLSIRLLVLALCFLITNTIATMGFFARVSDPHVSTPALSDAQLHAFTW